MPGLFTKVLISSPLIPAGDCYLWKPDLVWLHLVSDFLIALAYYAISVALVYFVNKRRQLPFNWMFLLFGAFIIACGTTHLMEIWTIWHPNYWLSGTFKAITAIISVYTAQRLVSSMPQLLELPSPAQLEAANRELQQQIVERQRVQEALYASQSRLAGILDIANDGIISVDETQTITLFNQGAEKLFGYTADEVLGQPLDWLLPSRFVQAHRQHIREFSHSPDIARRMGDRREVFARRKDGTEFAAEASISKLELNDERVFTVILHDISDRKAAEAALRASELRYSTLAKAVPVGIFRTDVQGDCIYVNERWCQMTGLTFQEALGTGWVRCLHPEDRERIYTEFKQAEAQYLPCQTECRLQHSDGIIIWIFAQAVPEWGNNQEFIGYVGAIADISALKQSEAALQESLLRYYTLAKAVPVGIFRTNIEGDCIYVNQRWSEITGVTYQNALKEGWVAALHPEDRERVYTECHQAAQQNLPFQAEYRFMRPNGEITWVFGQAVPEIGNDGELIGYVGAIADISDRQAALRDRKLAEAKLQKAYDELEHRVHQRTVELFEANLALHSEIAERERAQQGINLNYAIARVLTEAESLVEMIPRILSAICTTLRWDWGEFWRIDPQVNLLRCTQIWQSQWIQSPDWEACTQQISFPPTVGFPGQIWATSQSAWISDVAQEKNFLRSSIAASVGLHAAFGFPIKVGSETLGVITCFHRQIRLPDPDLLEIVTSLGNQIGQFIKRKRAEESLQEIAALQQAILNSANYAIISTEVNGTIRTFNPAAERMLGYSAAEVIGKTTPEIFHDPDEFVQRAQELSQELGLIQPVPAIETFIAKASRGEVVEREWTYIRKDGSRFPVLLSITALRDERDNITGFLGIVSDISEEKQAKEALQKYAAEIEDLYNNAPCGYHSLDADGIFVRINDTELNMLRYARHEVLGKNASEFIAPESLPIFQRNFPILKQRGWVREQELQMMCKDGSLLPVSLNATAIKDNAGNFLCSRTTIFDISDRKAAELALRQSEERWQLAVQGSTDGIWDWNFFTKEHYFSPRFLEILGYQSDEFNLEILSQCVHPDDLAQVEATFQRHLNQETDYFTSEHRLRCKDGHYKWILSRGQALWDQTGKPLRVVGSLTDISDRKRAEEELRWKEALLRAMADTSPLAFYVVDRRTEAILYFNHRFCEIWGIEHLESQMQLGELKNNDIAANCLLLVANASAFVEACQSLKSEENRTIIEDEIPLVDGRIIRRFSAQIRDEDDRYFGRLFLFEDISDRKRAEAERLQLLAQEQTAKQEAVTAKNRIANILSSITDGFFALDSDWRFTYFNRQAGRILHKQADDLIGQKIWDIFPEIFGTIFYCEYHRAVAQQVSVEFEEYYQPYNIWLEVHAYPTRKGLAVYFQDITQRKRSQESIRNLTRALEMAVVGISQIDMQGKFTMVNPSYTSLLGYQSEELIGMDWQLTVHPDDQEKAIAAYAQMLVTDKAEVELLAVRKDGSVFDQKIVLVKAYGPQEEFIGHYGFMKDISDRREIEKLKEQFVSVVSHELRTPLTSIAGALDLLASGILQAQPEEAQRMLTIAANNTDRLVRLINDILDIERIRSGKVSMQKQICDVADLMTDAVQVVQELAERAGITLDLSLVCARLWADPDRIVQVLTNLLGNAIKFSPPGSTVWLSAEIQPPQKQQGVEPHTPDVELHSIIIKVKDQGRGIPQDKLETIFEPFQQVDASDSRAKGGTGLGLAICRSILQHHEGQIWVESTLGEGSTFCFNLPLLWEVEAESAVIESSAPLILVCDDDPDVRTVVQAMLEQHGYRVICAASGQQAVALAAHNHPNVILLNLSMPNMDGWETLAVLKQREDTQNIPAIILSGWSPIGEGVTYPNVSDWIVKPPDQQSLLQALQRALAKHNQTLKVLVVEDDTELAQVLATMFERHGIETFYARTGREAIQLSQTIIPDLLILDLALPECDGFTVVDWLRHHNRLCAVPLVVYTAQDLSASDRQRLKLGQTLFFTKGRITPQEFEQRAINLLNRMIHGQNGDPMLQHLRILSNQPDQPQTQSDHDS